MMMVSLVLRKCDVYNMGYAASFRSGYAHLHLSEMDLLLQVYIRTKHGQGHQATTN